MRDLRPDQLKTGWVLPLFFTGVAVLVGRLYDIQINNHEFLVRKAREQTQTTVVIPPLRGTVFDANGRPLAFSLKAPSIFADPGIAAVPARARRWLPGVLGVPQNLFKKFLVATPNIVHDVTDPTRARILRVTRALARYLRVPEEPLRARVEAAMDARLDQIARKVAPLVGVPEAEVRRRLGRPRRFVWLKRPADEACARRVRDLHLRGICVRDEPRRRAAERLVIGQWLGHVGANGRGLEGLELQFDRDLRGAPGLARLCRDGRGRRIADSAEPTLPPVHGRNLYLTIDGRIQGLVDEELARVCEEFDPLSVSAIVMHPHTGRILAMGSAPGLVVSEKSRLTTEELRRRQRNHPVQSVYEYGSTFKPFVVAAAVDRRLVTPGTRIDCEGGRWTVRNERGRPVRTLHDAHPYGVLSAADVIVHSSNIGAAKIGLYYLGAERLRQTVAFFHFGRRLGIRLPAEEPGIVTPAERWNLHTTTSVPMGQEIAGTPLQLITAFCALINGGRLMQPYLVEAIEDPNTGTVNRRTPKVLWRVIREETSATMRRILGEVVRRGTGRRLRTARYPIGGKTGTAQKSGPGGYAPGKYVASFVGFAPVDQPEICVLVLVDEPKGPHYGGSVAAPAVGRIIEKTLDLLRSLPHEDGPALAATRTVP